MYAPPTSTRCPANQKHDTAAQYRVFRRPCWGKSGGGDATGGKKVLGKVRLKEGYSRAEGGGTAGIGFCLSPERARSRTDSASLTSWTRRAAPPEESHSVRRWAGRRSGASARAASTWSVAEGGVMASGGGRCVLGEEWRQEMGRGLELSFTSSSCDEAREEVAILPALLRVRAA